ncbi:MAG: hypothetical protein ABL983_00095 [Nitrospira sp.]
MPDDQNPQTVVVTDIRMPFFSMVVFMVKWAIAAIPAFLILTVIGVLTWGMLSGVFLSMTTDKKAESIRATGIVGPSSIPTSRAPTEPSPTTAVYLDKIILKGVSVQPAVLGGKGVFGEVKNIGDRTVSTVEITIYCLDHNGRPIFEKSYHPVYVSTLSFGDSNAPLKPGYSRTFGVKIDDAPSEWNGKVDVKVTEVALTSDQSGT